jgi:hypothetical protein
MELENRKELVEQISKGNGILSELSKDRLESGTYTNDFGEEIIHTVWQQSKEDKKTAVSCWGVDVVQKVLNSDLKIKNYFVK